MLPEFMACLVQNMNLYSLQGLLLIKYHFLQNFFNLQLRLWNKISQMDDDDTRQTHRLEARIFFSNKCKQQHFLLMCISEMCWVHMWPKGANPIPLCWLGLCRLGFSTYGMIPVFLHQSSLSTCRMKADGGRPSNRVGRS